MSQIFSSTPIQQNTKSLGQDPNGYQQSSESFSDPMDFNETLQSSIKLRKNLIHSAALKICSKGSGSERRNESAKNVETKVPKYSPRRPKTRRQKEIAPFQSLYYIL